MRGWRFLIIISPFRDRERKKVRDEIRVYVTSYRMIRLFFHLFPVYHTMYYTYCDEPILYYIFLFLYIYLLNFTRLINYRLAYIPFFTYYSMYHCISYIDVSSILSMHINKLQVRKNRNQLHIHIISECDLFIYLFIYLFCKETYV